MAVRIKTISNDIQGAKRSPDHARVHNKASGESMQSSKILELEWEALGRKLNKHTGSGDGPEKLRRQLREKDEQLRQANNKIAALKKQVYALQEKQRMHERQPVNHNRPRLRAGRK